ncbi:hypothetical protein CPR19088_GLDEOEPO_01001 [Companilactobacillus paralimentarius]
MGTDPSQRTVSNLDFEPRKKHEFQNSSRGVSTKVLTPPSQRPKFLFLPASLLVSFYILNCKSNTIQCSLFAGIFRLEYYSLSVVLVDLLTTILNNILGIT